MAKRTQPEGNGQDPPRELTELDQWVIWKREANDKGELTKVPYRPVGNRKASSTRRNDWTSFERAQTALTKHDANGLGFVFSKDDPYCGVDLDHCIDEDGNVHPEAQAIIDGLASYAEYSPSGEGVHVIIKATLNGGGNRTANTPWGGNIEVYDQGRYFTFTGRRLVDCPVRRPPPGSFDRLQKMLSSSSHGAVDENWIEKARKNPKFVTLYVEGDISDYIGDNGKPDASAADFALLNLLKRYIGKARPWSILRAFKASALYRGEAKSGGDDYILRSIEKVCDEGDTKRKSRLEVYSLADAFGWADESIDWVVPEMLAAGEKMVLAGPPKAMKTWLELHIAFTVTTGGNVLDEPLWQVTEPQGVLVVQEESQRQRWGRRIKDVFEDFPDAPFLHTHRAGFSLMDQEHVNWLIGEVIDRGVRLVCIDPFQRVTPGVKENESGEMAVPWDAIHRIATETGAAVIVVHHSRKGDSAPSMESIRGSSRSAGEVDVLMVVQKDTYGTLECFLEGRELIRSESDNLVIKFDTSAPWRMGFAGVKIKTSGPVNKTVRAVEKVLQDVDEANALGVQDIRLKVQAALDDTRTTESIRKALKDLESNGELAFKPAPTGAGNLWWSTDTA